MQIVGPLLSPYDRWVFELASKIVLDWDMLATFYAAGRFDSCLRAGDHGLALIWLDVIRAVEAMSDSAAGGIH